MNMFARFDENPAVTLPVIKETKRYGWTDVKTVYPPQTKFAGRDGQRENSIPTTNKVCGGIKTKHLMPKSPGSLTWILANEMMMF